MKMLKYGWFAIVILCVVLLSLRSTRTILAQTTSSWALGWSPDGTQIAFGQLDGTIQITDASTGQLLHTLQTRNTSADTSTIVVLKWSPDSTKLAAADMSNKLYVWQIEDGQLLYSVLGKNTSYITDIDWSADGKRIATGSQMDVKLQIWDADTGQLLIENTGYMLGLSWHDNDLVSGTGNGIILIDASTGNYVRTVGIQDAQVTDVAWSPIGDLIASGGDDGKIRVWNALTGELIETLSGHAQSVTAVNWRADGQKIVSSSYDGTVIIWNIATGEAVQKYVGGLSVFRAQFSPDGGHIVYADADNVMHIASTFPFTTATATPQIPLATQTAIKSTYEFLGISQENDLAYPSGNDVVGIAWDEMDRRLATGHADGTVQIWDAATHQVTTTLPGHAGSVSSLAWNTTGDRLATGGADTIIRIWDVALKKLIKQLVGHKDGISALTWTADGKLISGGQPEQQNLRVWDTTTGFQTNKSDKFPSITSFEWSPNRDYLVYGSVAGFMGFINGTTLVPESLRYGQREISGVKGVQIEAWRRNSSQIAGANLSGEILIWDRNTNSKLITLQANDSTQVDFTTSSVVALAYSNDDTKLMAVSADGTFRIWDTANWHILRTTQVGSLIYAAHFSHDGRYLAFGSDGILHIEYISDVIVITPSANRIEATVTPTAAH